MACGLSSQLLPQLLGEGMTSYTCVFSSGKPARLTKIFTSLLAFRWNDSIILSALISHRAGLEIIKLSGGLCISLVSFSPAILSATMGFLIKSKAMRNPESKPPWQLMKMPKNLETVRQWTQDTKTKRCRDHSTACDVLYLSCEFLRTEGIEPLVNRVNPVPRTNSCLP